MVGIVSQNQRAWRRFLLQHPMESLEPRVLLSAAPGIAATLVCVLIANPVSDVAPVISGTICSVDGSTDGSSGEASTDSQAPAATPVDASGAASGNITDPNQTDTYSFQATVGQNYSVQIDTATLADGSVAIVDQDGVSQLDWAEAIGTSDSGSVIWKAPADGTYYVQASSGDGESTGTYSVSVAVAVAPVATPLDSSGSSSGNITDPNQIDTYSFQATAGQNYSVQINAAALADGSVTIVDQDGFSQLDWAEAVGTSTSDSVVWHAPADGTYYLQVTSGDGQSTGTYSVSVSVAQPPVSVPLDSTGAGSGNITDPNQTDMYSFQATAGQNYNVQIDATMLADGWVSIVDQDGVSQLDGAEAAGAGTSGLVVWQAPADGTYYLQVSSGDGQSTGTYAVSATPTSLGPTTYDGSGSDFSYVYDMNAPAPVQWFMGDGRVLASAGAPIAFDVPVALGRSAPAARNEKAPIPTATHTTSGGSAVKTSGEPVQQSKGVVADIASSKAVSDLFASQSSPIESGDLLHKPDDLFGNDGSLL